MPKSLQNLVLWTSPVLAACLIGFTVFNRVRMEHWFNRGTYYLIAALFGVWVWIVFRTAAVHWKGLKASLAQNRHGLWFSLLLTVAVFLTVPCSFRVMMDQPELVNVSKSMTYERRVDIHLEGYWQPDGYKPTARYIEKRPFLFPFLIHVVHVLTGYRPENAFVVNFIAQLVLFSLSFILAARLLGGPVWGYVTLLLLASQPLVTQCATSAGFETVQAVFFLAVLASLGWYLKKPSPDRLCFLWAQTIAFVNTRYESIAIAAALFFLMLPFVRWRDVAARAYVYALTPLLLLPTLWQRILFTSEIWNYDDGERPLSTPVFALKHAIRHNFDFVQKAMDFYSTLPYAGIVNIAGLAGLALFCVRFAGKKEVMSRPARRTAWIIGALIVLFWAIVTSYFYSNVDRSHEVRFYLIFVIVLSMFAVYLMSRWTIPGTKTVAVLLSLGCLLLYHPVAMTGALSKSHTLTREFKLMADYFRHEPDKRFVIVYDWPIVLTIFDYGATSFIKVNRNPEKTILSHLRSGELRDVFVVQRIKISKQGSRIASETSLDPGHFRLELIVELKNGRGKALRISRVIPENS